MKRYKKLWFALILSMAVIAGQSINANTKVEAQGISLTPNLTCTAYNSTNIFTTSGYKGQCTWFVYGRVLEKLNIKLPTEFYGNAIDWWGSNIKDKVYNYGSEPKADSIIVWSGGNSGSGHVGYVEKVEGDLVYFNEGNFSVRGNYQGNVEVLSKEAIKNRGNIFLKGYIYVKEKYVTPSSNVTLSGQVSLRSNNPLLSVRKGAGTSFGIIGNLQNKINVNILGKSANWYKIKFANSTGYICGDYVTLTQKVVPVIKVGTVKLTCKTSTLNVRVSPNGAVSNILRNGNKVNIIGQNGDFYKITYGKITGYASIKYISIV